MNLYRSIILSYLSVCVIKGYLWLWPWYSSEFLGVKLLFRLTLKLVIRNHLCVLFILLKIDLSMIEGTKICRMKRKHLDNIVQIFLHNALVS